MRLQGVLDSAVLGGTEGDEVAGEEVGRRSFGDIVFGSPLGKGT